MNTTQLECFLAVAETLNFSKAAEMVNISQLPSAIRSHRLRQAWGAVVSENEQKRTAYKRGTELYRRCGNDSQDGDEFYPSSEYQC